MSETFQLVMTEHPAWRVTERGSYRVFALTGGGQWLVTIKGSEMFSYPLTVGSEQPQPDVFRLPASTVIDARELWPGH